MEKKLKELIGKPNVWLFINSSNGWVKNVEILEVNSDTVSFCFQHESSTETKVWEKTTRIENILEIDIQVAVVPKCEIKLDHIRQRFIHLIEE